MCSQSNSIYVLVGIGTLLPIYFLETFIIWLFNNYITSKYESKVNVYEWAIIYQFFMSYIVAGLMEEIMKLILALIIKIDPNDKPYCVMMLSMAGALGIGTFETVVFVYNNRVSNSFLSALWTSILRSVIATTLHAATGTIIGAEIGKKHFALHKKSIFRIMIIPILLHGTYDFCALLGSNLYILTSDPIYFLFFFAVALVDTVAFVIAFKHVYELNKMEVHSRYEIVNPDDPPTDRALTLEDVVVNV